MCKGKKAEMQGSKVTKNGAVKKENGTVES